MIVTNEKIEVSTLMMERANMKKDAFTYGVPVDPKDPSKGLRWTHLAKLTDAALMRLKSTSCSKNSPPRLSL